MAKVENNTLRSSGDAAIARNENEEIGNAALVDVSNCASHDGGLVMAPENNAQGLSSSAFGSDLTELIWIDYFHRQQGNVHCTRCGVMQQDVAFYVVPEHRRDCPNHESIPLKESIKDIYSNLALADSSARVYFQASSAADNMEADKAVECRKKSESCADHEERTRAASINRAAGRSSMLSIIDEIMDEEANEGDAVDARRGSLQQSLQVVGCNSLQPSQPQVMFCCSQIPNNYLQNRIPTQWVGAAQLRMT